MTLILTRNHRSKARHTTERFHGNGTCPVDIPAATCQDRAQLLEPSTVDGTNSRGGHNRRTMLLAYMHNGETDPKTCACARVPENQQDWPFNHGIISLSHAGVRAWIGSTELASNEDSSPGFFRQMAFRRWSVGTRDNRFFVSIYGQIGLFHVLFYFTYEGFSYVRTPPIPK
jgi:hypothetical protein